MKKEVEKRQKRVAELEVDMGRAKGANTKNELETKLGKAKKEFASSADSFTLQTK